MGFGLLGRDGEILAPRSCGGRDSMIAFRGLSDHYVAQPSMGG